jgi:hypothetical protein
MSMELEQLQLQWNRLDQKLDQSLTLERELVRRVVVQPAQRRVNFLAFWPAVDVAFCAFGLLLGGMFLSDHWRDWRIVVPAGAVMIGLFALLADSVRQLQHVAELDWSGPVAEIQGSLQRLRIARIRQFKWIILLAPLFGFCGLMVALDWLFGSLSGGRVGVHDKLNASWIVANYIFGVLFVPLGYLVAKALAQRYHRRGWWQAVLDDISGKSLKVAAGDIERWASLGR